jgi:histidine triad (HIT) family protein
MADTRSCIFCRIARGEIPAQMVMNNKDVAAFKDLNPQAPVHILIIPKKHLASLDDANDSDLLGRMMSLAAAIARQEGIAKSGYRTVINTGKDGGQSVDHLHIHLLGGRAMAWPPG